MTVQLSDKIFALWPEIAMLCGATFCLLLCLSRSAAIRRFTAPTAVVTLLLAACLLSYTRPGSTLSYASDDAQVAVSVLPATTVHFVKSATVAVGFLLVLAAAALPRGLARERAVTGELSDPGPLIRGEFFAFLLLSLTGVMLCAAANDLVWLFLALELTSLPTYVLVATSRDRPEAQEAAVKYFFLGALAAAVFLYGFALMYGATGSTQFTTILHQLNTPGPSLARPLLLTGLVLSILGIAFKIAAVPMHFYVADVYQGAATPVSAFLAFVPKTAGFVSLLILLQLAGPLYGRPHQALIVLLWFMAAATMTYGNVLGLLQNNVKRLLAYSSIAHTGYMLVGLLTTLEPTDPHLSLGNGAAAILFYLVAYGLATLGAFSVLGALETRGQEAQTLDDISGLGRRYPVLGVILLICTLSLIGLPPLVGFIGKIYLFGSAIEHGYTGLVVIAVLNSAVSAAYYLRIVSACYFAAPNDNTHVPPSPLRWTVAAAAATAAIWLGIYANHLIDATHPVPSQTLQAQAQDNGHPRPIPQRIAQNPSGSLTSPRPTAQP